MICSKNYFISLLVLHPPSGITPKTPHFKCFWSTSWSDPVTAPLKAMRLPTNTSLVSSLSLILVCLCKMPSFEGYFWYGCPEFNFTCISVLLYLEIFRSNKIIIITYLNNVIENCWSILRPKLSPRLGKTDYRWVCVPYEFRNVRHSHLPILPTPNSISHHCTQCWSLWGTNWMYCRGTHPSSWEIGALVTICGFISNIPDVFWCVALLSSSNHFEGFWEGRGLQRYIVSFWVTSRYVFMTTLWKQKWICYLEI